MCSANRILFFLIVKLFTTICAFIRLYQVNRIIIFCHLQKDLQSYYQRIKSWRFGCESGSRNFTVSRRVSLACWYNKFIPFLLFYFLLRTFNYYLDWNILMLVLELCFRHLCQVPNLPYAIEFTKYILRCNILITFQWYRYCHYLHSLGI